MFWVGLSYVLLPIIFFAIVWMLVCLWALSKKPTDERIDRDLKTDYDDLKLHWTDTD